MTSDSKVVRELYYNRFGSFEIIKVADENTMCQFVSIFREVIMDTRFSEASIIHMEYNNALI